MPRGNVDISDRFEKAQNDLHQITNELLKKRSMTLVQMMLDVQDKLDEVRVEALESGTPD